MNENQNTLKNNFSSGEITPYMFGRDDVSKYANGVAELENFIVRPQGGISRRMGTKFCGEVHDSTSEVVIIPFEFSNVETYILEFSEYMMRVWKNGALVLDGPDPYEVVTPFASADVSRIYYAQSADVMYLTHPNHPPQRLSRFADDDWVIEDAPFEDGPYAVTKNQDIATTLWLTSISYTATITSTANDFVVGDVGKYVEYWKNGVLVIGEITAYVSPTQVTIEPLDNVVDSASIDTGAVLTYSSGKVLASLAIWSSETEYSYIKVGGSWYYLTTHDPIPVQTGTPPNAYSADVMTVSGAALTMVATTGKLTYSNQSITATLNASEEIFDASRDIGRSFRLIFSNRPVWGTITAHTNTKTVSVSLGIRVPNDKRDGQKFINDATTNNWRLGAWYVDNYPHCVTFHQGRLVFAGSRDEPNRVWMSVSDDFVSFAPSTIFDEVTDANAINFGLVSGEVNAVVWLQPGPVLLVGTVGDEFQVKPTNIGEALTPSNVNVTSQTPYGSQDGIRPVKIGASTMFIQEHGRRIRELTYSFEIDSFVAADITIVSEHILRKHLAANKIVYQQSPSSIVWVACEDGGLVSLTYEKAQEVFAWANHVIPGGIVESIAVIPSRNDKQDMVYMVVRRSVEETDVRYIEAFVPDFYPSSNTNKIGMRYLDSSIEYSGIATNVITGLEHLEGLEVGVLANYSVHPNRTVTGGQIELDYEATHAYVGIPFTSKLKVLPIQAPSQTGTSQGKLRKIVRIDAYLLDSIGLTYGQTLDSLEFPVSFRESGWIMGQSPVLFTGFVQLTDDKAFTRDSQFYIVQDQPYPLNILSLAPILKINE